MKHYLHTAAAATISLLVAGTSEAATVTKEYVATSAVGVVSDGRDTTGADHSLWISGGLGSNGMTAIGSDFDFTPTGRFTLFDDGTATLKGNVVSQDKDTASFIVDFSYDNTFVKSDGSPFTPTFKSENGSAATADTFYRNLTGGTLTGTGILAGLNLSVTRKPADGPWATQIGPSNGTNRGANNKNNNFGMANWFMITVVNADCGAFCTGNTTLDTLTGTQGDINIDLEPVPLPAAGLLLIGGLGGLAALRRLQRRKA